MGLCIIYAQNIGFMHPYALFSAFLYNFAKYTFSKVGKMTRIRKHDFFCYDGFTERDNLLEFIILFGFTTQKGVYYG